MSQRLYIPFQQLFTNLGAIAPGWKIATYETGTTTPKATYSNTGLTIANANPASGATTGNQVADADGRLGDMFIDNAATYKVILKDENDNVIQTMDPVDPQATSLNIFTPIPEAFWGTTSGTSTAFTLTSNVDISTVGYQNTQIFQLSFHTTCGASPTLNIDGLGALNLKKYTGQGTKVALEASDVTTQTYEARNDGTDIIILNPQKPYLDGRNITQATTTVKNVSYLSSQITIANNGSDANNDIDFSAGVFQFSDGSGQAVASALTKRLDASWVAGTNQGGLFTGSEASNTWYHCFAIYNPTTLASDFGFDTSITAANIPSGFTKYKRVGSIRNDGSSNILPFTQVKDTFLLTTPIADVATTQTLNSETLRTLTTPLGVNTISLLTFYLRSTGASAACGAKCYSPYNTSSTLGVQDYQLYAATGVTEQGCYVQALTNTSSQVKTNATTISNSPTATITIYTNGWIDLTL